MSSMKQAFGSFSGHKAWQWNKEESAVQLAHLLERLWEQGLAKEQLRDVLRCQTGGRFELADAAEMRATGQLALRMDLIDYHSTSVLRGHLRELFTPLRLSSAWMDDMELAVGEVAGNTIKHAEGGWCEIYTATKQLTVRIGDSGPGIHFAHIRKSLSVPGFSTKESLGLGYTLILSLVDMVWLATGPEGTTLQLCKYI